MPRYCNGRKAGGIGLGGAFALLGPGVPEFGVVWEEELEGGVVDMAAAQVATRCARL